MVNQSQQIRPAKTATQALSTNLDELPSLQASLKGATCLPALERLISAKRTVELTDHQAETWLASLSVFDARIVNEAIIRIANSEDPFPDLGKLVMRCEAMRRERSGTPATGDVKLGTKTVRQLAAAWGVEVE